MAGMSKKLRSFLERAGQQRSKSSLSGYPSGSDLHYLWCWHTQLGTRLEHGPAVNEFDSMYFRPDPHARGALVSMAVRYPGAFKQIDDKLTLVEHSFASFLDATENDSRRAEFANAMESLHCVVLRAVEEIAKAEKPQSIQRPRVSAAEANVRAREVLKRKPRRGKHWSIRSLAKEIGCSFGTVHKLPAWQAYAEQNSLGRERWDVKSRAVSLSSKTLATIGQDDPELDKLVQEQRADDEGSPLNPLRRRNKLTKKS